MLQCEEQCIDHNPYYLSGLLRALFFPTTLAVYPVHNLRPHVAVKVKFTAPLLLACIFSFSFSFFFFFFFFFPLTIYLFSLYANRLQILHKHCFQFLLALTALQEKLKTMFLQKKMCRDQVACRDVNKPSS